jgi:AraC-like DNA-binding protein
VLRGRDFIESNWTGRITLEEIAAAAAMSPYHFHRSFRRTIGETPLACLTRLRLEAAASKLRLTDEPVQDICTAIGFESLPSFTHRFHSRFGCAPGRYRRIFRKIR